MPEDPQTDKLLTLDWNYVNSDRQTDQKVKIFYFSLTTCVYCKKGIQFLNDRGIAYRWLYLDRLDLELKKEIKDWVQKTYKLTSRMASPFVIFRLGEEEYYSNGYDPDYWKSKLR
jgi:glutaredoxin-like protein NrdH